MTETYTVVAHNKKQQGKRDALWIHKNRQRWRHVDISVENQKKKKKKLFQVDALGIDPSTYRMLSDRSTI